MKDYQVMPELTDEEYAELKADIAERGVMVPIEFDEDGNCLDGHHRLKICEELGITDYPTVVRAGWSETAKYEHALELNIARRHLTQEQQRAAIEKTILEHPEMKDVQIARIFKVSPTTVGTIRAELVENVQISNVENWTPRQRGQAIEEAIAEHPEMTDRQIARETGASPTTVGTRRKKMVSVFNPSKRDADALKDPDIQRRLAENEGMNVAGAIREQKRERLSTVSEENKGIKVDVSSADGIYYFWQEGDPCGEIQNTDCLEAMSKMSGESVDLIIADPPYFEVWGDFDFKWESEAVYLEWIHECLIEFERILKPSGTLMLWGALGKDRLTLCKVALWIEENNLFALQNWITQRNTRGNGAEKNYMSCREEVLFYTKTDSYTFNVPYTDEISDRADYGANGKPRENDYKRVSNVWCDIAEASQSSIERCFHPTVKALKLCDRIIQTHSNKNDMIYIPFAGSGSEVVSCIKNDRRFIATEINEGYFTKSIERIKDLLRKESE